MQNKIIVSGTGCCLVDQLYNNIDFNSNAVRPYLSIKRGDGGLTPGNLVFTEEFENFCGSSADEAVKIITGGRKYDKLNIGGPSIVSLINVTQIVDLDQSEVRFYGLGGNDELGQYLLSSLNKTQVKLKSFRLIDHPTPSTVVLSDPSYDNGHGERMFINSIGAAWHFSPSDLDEDFFNSDIVVFGGTALVPQIHDNLDILLEKAKSRGCKTVVNTVFDFRNEKTSPNKKWPLGSSDVTYKYIDLLITDREEALRLSGENNLDSAVRFFITNKVSSLIITNGSGRITFFSDGRFFKPVGIKELPASARVIKELSVNKNGDTTGCGDNFAGGVIASIVSQIGSNIRNPDITEACCWGIVSGGFTCFYVGGTYFEEYQGEKLSKLKPYYDSYREQISH